LFSWFRVSHNRIIFHFALHPKFIIFAVNAHLRFCFSESRIKCK
jgi:hypothetical protein